MTPHIDIVFDGPPSHESGRFIEVEDCMQQSVRFGQWIQRKDGYWVLRITKFDCSVFGDYEPPDPPGWEGGFAPNH